jgi:uroporphyrinogen-III synthase
MCDELTHVLQERGVVVAHVACYETLSVEPTSAQRETLANADVVFIGAPSAWAVAKDFVSPSAWVIVPGTTTGEVVRASHEQVFEGWNQATCDMLASLEG